MKRFLLNAIVIFAIVWNVCLVIEAMQYGKLDLAIFPGVGVLFCLWILLEDLFLYKKPPTSKKR